MNRNLRHRLENTIDALLMVALVVFLMVYFDIRYLFQDTVVTGGDTASWHAVAKHLSDILIPNGRLMGWDMGNFGGYPNFSFYFLPPFLLAVLPAKLLGIPLTIALKWAIMSGIFLFPVTTYLGLRKMNYRFPIPAVGAWFAAVLMFNESWTMFGGNTLSTFAGEFCYMFAFALFALFIGSFYRGYRTGTRAMFNGLLLGLIGLSHLFVFIPALMVMVYAVFDRARIRYLLEVGLTGFICMAFWILPLIAYRHPYTTPVYMIWQEFVNLRYTMAGVLAIALFVIPGAYRHVLRGTQNGISAYAWGFIGLCSAAVFAVSYLAGQYLILGTNLWYTGLNVPDYGSGLLVQSAARQLDQWMIPVAAAIALAMAVLGIRRRHEGIRPFTAFCRRVAGLCFSVVMVAAVLKGYSTISHVVPDVALRSRLIHPLSFVSVGCLTLLGLGAARWIAKKRGGEPRGAAAESGSRYFMWIWLAMGCGVVYFSAHFLQVPDIRYLPPLIYALVMSFIAEAVGPLLIEKSAGVRVISAIAASYVAFLAIVFGAVNADSWYRFNNRGYEATTGYADFAAVNRYLENAYADRGLDPLNAPRVAYEKCDLYGPYGGDRAFESLPLFSGRQTLEGIHYAGSIASRCMAFIQTEFSRDIKTPKPQILSRINPETLPAHFDLYNISQLVVMTDTMKEALKDTAGFEQQARFGAISLYRYTGSADRYVDIPTIRPVLYSGKNWVDDFFEWFKHPETNDVLLVPEQFVTDENDRATLTAMADDVADLDRFRSRLLDREGAEIHSRLDHLRIEFTTSKVGVPHLIKVSYFPNWKVSGANGVYPVSPHLMLVIPRQPEVILTYARSVWEIIGGWITCAGLILLAAIALSARVPAIRRWRPLEALNRAAERICNILQLAVSILKPYLLALVVAGSIALVISGAMLRNQPVRTYIAGFHEYKKANALFDNGKKQEAEEHWLKAIGIMEQLLLDRARYDHRDVINCLLYTSMCYERLNKDDQARRWYRILLDEYPYSRYVAEAHVKLARISRHHAGSIWAEGLNEIRNGLIPEGFRRLNEALDRLEKGIDDYQAAVTNDPYSVWAGYTMEDLNHVQAGINRYAADMESISDNRDVMNRLELLNSRIHDIHNT